MEAPGKGFLILGEGSGQEPADWLIKKLQKIYFWKVHFRASGLLY